MAVEDVIGLSVSEETDSIYYVWTYNMVIQGTAQCGPSKVLITQKDIFRYHEVWFTNDDNEDEQISIYPCDVTWRGSEHGWNYNIDAIEFYTWVRYY